MYTIPEPTADSISTVAAKERVHIAVCKQWLGQQTLGTKEIWLHHSLCRMVHSSSSAQCCIHILLSSLFLRLLLLPHYHTAAINMDLHLHTNQILCLKACVHVQYDWDTQDRHHVNTHLHKWASVHQQGSPCLSAPQSFPLAPSPMYSNKNCKKLFTSVYWPQSAVNGQWSRMNTVSGNFSLKSGCWKRFVTLHGKLISSVVCLVIVVLVVIH